MGWVLHSTCAHPNRPPNPPLTLWVCPFVVHTHPLQHVKDKGGRGQNWLTLPRLSASVGVPSEDHHDEHEVKHTAERGVLQVLSALAGGGPPSAAARGDLGRGALPAPAAPTLTDLWSLAPVDAIYDGEPLCVDLRLSWYVAVARACLASSAGGPGQPPRRGGHATLAPPASSPSRRTFPTGSPLALVNLDRVIERGWLPRAWSQAAAVDRGALEALCPPGTTLTTAVFPAGFALVPESVVRRCGEVGLAGLGVSYEDVPLEPGCVRVLGPLVRAVEGIAPRRVGNVATLYHGTFPSLVPSIQTNGLWRATCKVKPECKVRGEGRRVGVGEGACVCVCVCV